MHEYLSLYSGTFASFSPSFPALFLSSEFLGLFMVFYWEGTILLVSAGGLMGVYLSLVEGAWHGVQWFEDLNNLGNV